MKKLLALFVLSIILSFTQVARGQGVFTSLATGDWNAATSWTLSSGTDADGIPDADDNVTIGSKCIITVSANTTVECNNLTVAGSSAISLTMAGANSIVNIYGSLSATAAPSGENYIDCRADATAKVVFKRTTNGPLFGSTWAAVGTGFRFDVNLPVGIVGTTTTAIKAREITITSGVFSVSGGLRPDNTAANSGILTIQDGATLIVTAAISKTGTSNTPFASLTMNGTGKIIINGTFGTALPAVNSGFPVYTLSGGAVIEYQGGAQTIADINYPNLVINATAAANAKTWSPAANRLATSVNVAQGVFAFGSGVTCTVSGNILVSANGTIAPASSANRFVAAGAGRTFTVNGTARVVSNETQTPAATSPFSYQYNNFSTYTFAPASWISFRSPTTTSVTQGIDGITGSPFGNVEIAAITALSAAGSNTHTFKTNVDIAGILAFPRLVVNTSLIINFGSNAIKVGGCIQLNGSNSSTQSGGRTYNMGTSTIELNGSIAQTMLGGIDLPDAFSNLKLNNSAGVTLSSNINVNNLIIGAGTTFNVNPAKQLTVNTTLTNDGTMNLRSDATGTATILTPAVIGGAGSYYVEQYFAEARNSYVSSPVASASKSVFESVAPRLYSFDEVSGSAAGTWLEEVDDTQLVVGKGYVAEVTTPGIVRFTGGVLNAGNYEITKMTSTASTSYRGFHLMGNPYPSFLDWDAVSKTNLASSLWYRTRSKVKNSSYVYETYGVVSGKGTNNSGRGNVTKDIAPMQAFWVRVGEGAEGSVTFTNAARSHQDQNLEVNRFKNIALSEQQVLRLKVSNDTHSDEAIVLFDANASNAFDAYDSPKMSNNNVAVPEICTVVGAENLVINGMNGVTENQELPLRFKTGTAGTFTIKATEITHFANDMQIVLKDKMLNTQQVLRVGSEYVFASDAVNDTNRFSVLFRSTAAVTGIEVAGAEKMNAIVYVNANGQIVVERTDVIKGMVSVCNALGQQVLKTDIIGTNALLKKQFSAGVYFVSLTVEGKTIAQKIIIKK